MLRHNLLLIYRNFKRFKSTFFINLIGLSTGLACALLIFLWVNDELHVDKFHEKDSQLFQVMEHVDQAGSTITRQTTAGPTAEALANEMPEVEYAVTSTMNNIGNHTLSIGNHNTKARGIYASADYFKLFSYEIIQSDKNRVLSDKSSIVISEALAIRLFGSTKNIIGKTIEWEHTKQYRVSGILKDISRLSSAQFDFILPFEAFRSDNEWVNSWGNTSPQTYLLMKKGTDISRFNHKIADLVRTKTEGEDHRTPFVTPYSDTYLYNRYDNGIQTGGRIEYVRLFSIIALFILLIACINFMNLSTARASRRLKEVGIKKVAGAPRRTLIIQYLGESTFMALLSLVVALLLVVVLLPQFNNITEKQLSLNFNVPFTLTLLGIALVTGLIAGSYPALYLSGFNPITVLKGGKLNNFMGELWARKGLVVFQFALSVTLIVSVWVVYQQIKFIQTQHLGYAKDNIVIFGKEGKLNEKEKAEAFLTEIKNIPGIVEVSSAGHGMTGHNSGTSDMVWPGKDPDDRTEFERFPVNHDMIKILGIPIKEGRTFSKDFGADSTKIIFNEAAIKFMGLTDPIGKTVKFWGEDREIIGVVKDFHFESFHEEIKPLFFYLNPQHTWNIMIKIEAGKEHETLTQLQRFYGEFNPGFSLDYTFLDEDYQTLYTTEQRVSTLSKYFAGLAILISCLGLFGLAAFTAERRIKEIGIRKVLGASEWKIVRLLSSDFAKMVLVAIVVALPVSYYFAKNWLDGFAFKIDLEWWYFVGAGLLTMIIALFTVSFQSIKTALMNPVKSLRTE